MSTEKKTSIVSGFYKLPIGKRREFVTHFANLSEDDTKIFSSYLDFATADCMIENVLGTFELPLGLAVNFLINEKDYIIPMVTEESSVVAAASNAAKIARIKGGFSASCSKPLMIGQLQLLHIGDVVTAAQEILNHKEQILILANSQDKIGKKSANAGSRIVPKPKPENRVRADAPRATRGASTSSMTR